MFNWHVYLSETGAEVSPPTLFAHVTQSMNQLVKKGDTFEACCSSLCDPIRAESSSESSESHWWPVEVVLVSGHLMLLKWCNPMDWHGQKLDEFQPLTPIGVKYKTIRKSFKMTGCFWFDMKGPNWHNIRPIAPPSTKDTSIWSIVDCKDTSHPDYDWLNQLKHRIVNQLFFEYRSVYCYETIRIGGYFECEHEYDPNCIWPVKVSLLFGPSYCHVHRFCQILVVA